MALIIGRGELFRFLEKIFFEEKESFVNIVKWTKGMVREVKRKEEREKHRGKREKEYDSVKSEKHILARTHMHTYVSHVEMRMQASGRTHARTKVVSFAIKEVLPKESKQKIVCVRPLALEKLKHIFKHMRTHARRTHLTQVSSVLHSTAFAYENKWKNS